MLRGYFVLYVPGAAGWSRDGHQVRFEFALGIRNCDCEQIANNCLFLNLEAIFGGGVGERVTSLTAGEGIKKTEVQDQKGGDGSPCGSREREELLEATPCLLKSASVVGFS